jgi:Alpha/beta hydrolase domain
VRGPGLLGAFGVGYTILVPQVDADGNDVGGVRSTTLQAPLGTYTGWNLGRPDRWPNHLCSLQGSFIPFAKTRAERIAVGDPRPSLEERYGDHAGYVAAVRAATERLEAERLLLPEDAARLVSEAEASDVLR